MPSVFDISAAQTSILDEEQLWDRLESECTDHAHFEAQGDEHADIDLRLVEKIERYLEPRLGAWEGSDHWFHNLDSYGDGIRSLSFSKDVFDPKFIDALRDLLSGEHVTFCVLCMIHRDLSSEGDTRIGTIAIFAEKLLMSRPVAEAYGLI